MTVHEDHLDGWDAIDAAGRDVGAGDRVLFDNQEHTVAEVFGRQLQLEGSESTLVEAADVVVLTPDETLLGYKALTGLRMIHQFIEPDDPDGGPSAADTCQALYALLADIGLEVS